MSKNLKIAIASLVATSAIVPAAVASANTEDVTTTTAVPLKYIQNAAANKVVADGVYNIDIELYDKNGNPGYKAMQTHIKNTGKLVVRKGKYFIQFEASEASASMIKGYYAYETYDAEKSDLTVVSESPTVVEIPVDSLESISKAGVWVYAKYPGGEHSQVYQFGIGIKDAANLNLPSAAPVFVYKDESTELSIMNGKYLSVTSSVSVNENGKYDVGLTFPEGQHVQEFIFEGQTIANPVNTTDDKGNTVSVYTVEVDNPIGLYDATVDLHVKSTINGQPFEYKEVYDIQIQIGGKQNPFKDITKSYAYKNVVSLYNKGIFVSAEKFNPKNDLPRGHLALMLNRAFDLEVPATTVFTDISKQTKEVQDAVKALNAYGIIKGATATTFNPTGSIKRFEAALMIDRLLAKQGIVAEKGLTSTFTDVKKLTAEAQSSIAHLAKLGVVNGKGYNKFDPNAVLTRQEMAVILDKALKLIEKQ